MNILNDFLYTGGDDRKIKVWDLKKDTLCVEEFTGHEDGVVSLEFAGGMLYSGSFDHSIRSWDLKEMFDRIRERSIMFKEDLWSKKHDAWYIKLYGKKKKKKSKKK
jgi:WD40 repeat protein